MNSASVPSAAPRHGGAPSANDNLGRNLRYLCSYYRSISEVCRKIGINRQQFNKYLDGGARPSAHNLKRICDFFGLEEYEILSPPADLKRLVEIKGIPATGARPAQIHMGHIEALLSLDAEVFRDYYGYYYKYYYSFSYPGRILKCLVSIFEVEGTACYKCVERLVDRGGGFKQRYVFKYVGVLFFLRDRIFMVDREALIGNEISETILYPSTKSKVGELPGLMIGVSGKTSREPICSRVLLEYLGPQIDLRRAMESCGLYAADSPAIDESVKRAIDNTTRTGDFAIRALPV